MNREMFIWTVGLLSGLGLGILITALFLTIEPSLFEGILP